MLHARSIDFHHPEHSSFHLQRGYNCSMKLSVVPEKNDVWYKQGLNFTCTCCGNCCTGGPGYVWISEEEIRRLAAHLNLTPEETVEQYCRKINGKFSLKESRSVSGSYDCVFLKEIKPPRTSRKGVAIVQAKRVCGIYEARPLQCRTWPFWPENLESKADWEIETRKCPGMNTGTHYPVEKIHQLRDSKDWPVKPPSSDSRAKPSKS
jgi:Fe-S-cluster containining protein